jgi:signal transduction histidine kinase
LFREAERTIATARVLLAISGLFAIWIEPAEPARYVEVTYTLHFIYVLYSIALAAVVWERPNPDWLPIATHAADIAVFSVFQYLTQAPSSPFFVYFIFSLFCGALRWGSRGTLGTGAVLLVAYVTMSAVMRWTFGPAEFDLNHFIVRIVNLLMTGTFLVYLGRHEERLRKNIESLGRWPAAVGDSDRVVEKVMAYAAGILGAGRSLAVWATPDQQRIHVAVWSGDGFAASIYPPSEFDPLVNDALKDVTFVRASVSDGPVAVGDGREPLSDLRINPRLLPMLTGSGLASAKLSTERVSGRVFFTDIVTARSEEIVSLMEVVAGQIGASIDQLSATEQLKAIAASEERIRLARDLHDGVLQSLTGIRLEIRAVAGALNGDAARSRDRLAAIERALAIEQRELRFFISGLGSPASLEPLGDGDTLASRLHALRERIALEWKVPVTIRIAHGPNSLPESLEQAIPLMVHEAIVNALKHAEPSRVSVTIEGGPSELRIIVADDGHGFPFRGRYDHTALAETEVGPKSLLERVTSLGGRMSVESSHAGSRVEMRLSLET